MANNMTYLTSNVLRDYFFRSMTSGTALLNKAGGWSIALTGPVPSSNSTSSNCNEVPNAGSYVRQTLAMSDANWSILGTSTSGVAYNASTISFPQATAAWGWCSGCMLTDSAVYGAGNAYFWGSLANPRDVNSTDQFTINPSGLGITWS